jgi:transposase-like protein
MSKKPPVAEPADEQPGVGGRPTKYDEAFPSIAYEHCLLGATDKELAEFFGIAESTLYEWKKEYPEFSEAIKKGKAPADAQIATALFNRANGAEWVEEQAFKLKTVTYEGGKRVLEEERLEVVEVTRRAPPDTTAAIFWLKNRKPEVWRDKQDLELSGEVKIPELTVVVKRREAET